MNEAATDVAIIGGGLAGLTLALHLRRAMPDVRVTVLERRSGAAPDAAFKVGESTVEVGAHYLADTLGLREALDTAQIRKFGFRFFFSDGRDDIDRCTEIGVSQLFPTPSWQLDRGRLENDLADRVRAAGVDLHDGASVKAFEVNAGDTPHRIEYEQAGERRVLDARWLVDAAGRRGLLRRHFDLTVDNGHAANAVWWRVEGRVDPNDWSDDPAWIERCTPPERWRSTNHLCGPGYWVWLIPLASGAHSVGIVCDASMHPLDTMNTHEKAMAWLQRHQPRLVRALASPSHGLLDFAFLRGYSHGSRQVFSGDRWALTGEAGPFLDPFYSPGSDFIAIANHYIVALVERDLAGEPVGAHAMLFERLLLSFYDNMLPLYRGQYPLMGDVQVMPVKVIWDYTFYWGLLAPLAFSGRLADLDVLGRLREPMLAGSALNERMQALFRDWGTANEAAGQAADPQPGRFLDQFHIDWFNAMNGALNDALDRDAFVARVHDNLLRMQALAAEIAGQAVACHPGLELHGLQPMDGPATLLDPAWYAQADVRAQPNG
ncbi:NAD(P)/FAD-dependent oxidoreductase [Lysobacter sp. SG-8]|uniref:NAD(P)/FAD-dependent oxidoreductase n=1 Tax=Marilutibacter penaei TaxID=2759900 RepID=A0A7W3U266_9GAMM|nr:NAD(P)/FAD-dependent oxidoreductase [Lysobacter penaei]MBB1087235.1 NAD(P)/FAD-dependent oxidoreductase [Lysobacter penaei]